jgi:hypothetical protein
MRGGADPGRWHQPPEPMRAYSGCLRTKPDCRGVPDRLPLDFDRFKYCSLRPRRLCLSVELLADARLSRQSNLQPEHVPRQLRHASRRYYLCPENSDLCRIIVYWKPGVRDRIHWAQISGRICQLSRRAVWRPNDIV